MKEKSQLELLYERFLRNQCTEEEFDLLFQHFHTNNKEELDRLITSELESADDAVVETSQERITLARVYSEVKSKIHPQTEEPRRLPFYRSFYRISAAAAVLVIVSFGIWFHLHTSEPSAVQVATNQFETDIAPGSNRAFLTLGDGTKLALTDATDGKLAREAGVIITKREDAQLVYTVINEDTKNVNAPQFNVIETPRGGQYQIKLPDGTKIWLNAASSLRYPTVFAGNERRVELIGEAYFEVAENKNMPFKVVSNNQVVEVLGTHFNINAYPEEKSMRTTLLEGSVNVHVDDRAVLLKPGQQALVGQSVLVKEVDLQEYVAWKNGRTQFSNASIQSIMRMLSRWYDVEVEYQGEFINTGFGGSVSRSKNISEILKLLELTGDVHFKIEGRRVIVMP